MSNSFILNGGLQGLSFPFFLPANPLSQPSMQANRTDKGPVKRVGIGLILSIHWDALRAAPRAYLTALWWRLRGKRLRARNQFAPLLSHASRAYELWMLQQEAAVCGAPGGEANGVNPPLVALVDAGVGQGDIEETIRSLHAEGVTVLPIGTPGIPTLADAALRIDWDTRPWLMPVVAGDRLAVGAAAAYRAAIAEAPAEMAMRIIYGDDDLLDEVGKRHAPHFKPDWNSELFRHFDYISGSCILRAGREDIEPFTASADWMIRLTEALAGEGRPLHLRRIQHHRRSRPRPSLPAALDIPKRELPPVTIIIPTRNRMDLLKTCLDGVAATDYPDIEVIVVDNDSDDPQTLSYLDSLDPTRHRVLRHSGAFNFSAINNHAVAQARGRLLCLLNNDVEMVDPAWLKIMAVQAQRKDVGAVGAQLFYPDGRIQHAGVVIGVGNAAGHAHRLLHPEDEGYFRRHALPQFIMAVTAACLVVERDCFLEVDGFDEKNFAVAFNDVDLCLKLNRRGWQSFYEPRAKLIHHESVSRGLDRDPPGAARLAKELAALQRIWRTGEITDPFHHPQLSRASEQFALGL